MAASKHITGARELNPEVSYKNPDAKLGDKTDWSCDDLAGWALFIEAVLNSHHGLSDQSWEQGLAAIDKAIAYFPDRPSYHLRRAIILSRLFRRKEAYASAEKALELNPSDFEAITMKDRFDADPLIGKHPPKYLGSNALILLAIALGAFSIYTWNAIFFFIAVGMFFYATNILSFSEDLERRMLHEERMAGNKGPHDL